jgi:hypothetical protein
MGVQSPVVIVNNTKERFAQVEATMRQMYQVGASTKNGARTTFFFHTEKDQKGAAFFMESEGIEVLATRIYDIGNS